MANFTDIIQDKIRKRPSADTIFSSKARQERVEEYRASLGLEGPFLPNPTLWETTQNVRLKKEDIFKEGELATLDDAKKTNIMEKMRLILTSPPTDALKTFNENFSAIYKDLSETVGESRHPREPIDLLRVVQKELMELIQEQHKAEIEQLKMAFLPVTAAEINLIKSNYDEAYYNASKTDNELELAKEKGTTPQELKNFEDKAKIAWEAFNAEEIKYEKLKIQQQPKELPTSIAIHDELKKKLQEDQTKQNDSFEKSFQETEKKLHHAAQVERERVNFFAMLYNHSAHRTQMREAIEKASQRALKRNPKKDQGIEVTHDDNGNALFKGITLEDLDILETVTGRPIQDNKNGTYSMKFPHPWNALYHKSSKELMRQDLESLAGAIRATGAEHYTINLTNKDEKEALKAAREAYAAAIRVGFDPEKITIKVNGTVKDSKELFKEFPNRHDNLLKEAKTNEAERKAWLEQEPKKVKSLEDYKKEFQKVRETEAAKEKKDPAAAPPPLPENSEEAASGTAGPTGPAG